MIGSPINLGLRYGVGLGLAYVVNVQVLTWLGLGLTGWVFAIDIALLSVVWGAALLRRRPRRSGLPGRLAGGLLMAVTLVAASGLIQQVYLVVYATMIDPEWVDRVVDTRRQLLLEAGVAVGEIEDRLVAVRQLFRPRRMLTTGLVLPGLWKLLIAGIVALLLWPFSSWKRRREPA